MYGYQVFIFSRLSWYVADCVHLAMINKYTCAVFFSTTETESHGLFAVFPLFFRPLSIHRPSRCSCCECTCQKSDFYDDDDDYYGGCGGSFACVDPSAPCANDDDITIDLFDDCDTVDMSDAYCNNGNNRPECSEYGVLALMGILFPRLSCARGPNRREKDRNVQRTPRDMLYYRDLV